MATAKNAQVQAQQAQQAQIEALQAQQAQQAQIEALQAQVEALQAQVVTQVKQRAVKVKANADLRDLVKFESASLNVCYFTGRYNYSNKTAAAAVARFKNKNATAKNANMLALANAEDLVAVHVLTQQNENAIDAYKLHYSNIAAQTMLVLSTNTNSKSNSLTLEQQLAQLQQNDATATNVQHVAVQSYYNAVLA